MEIFGIRLRWPRPQEPHDIEARTYESLERAGIYGHEADVEVLRGEDGIIVLVTVHSNDGVLWQFGPQIERRVACRLHERYGIKISALRITRGAAHALTDHPYFVNSEQMFDVLCAERRRQKRLDGLTNYLHTVGPSKRPAQVERRSTRHAIELECQRLPDLQVDLPPLQPLSERRRSAGRV